MHAELSPATDRQFLLVCESEVGRFQHSGTWRFALEHVDGREFLEASDVESGDANRLALLAVVRGLEALPGPSGVTLLTTSRYIIRSISESLPRWRAANFQWEYFGTRTSVTNSDLWLRVDRALDIHQVSACYVAAAQQVGRQRAIAAHSTVESSSVSDSLRRWLLGRCGIMGPSQGSSQLAIA